MFQNTYSGLRVFVTGNTGFKGSWLTYWLEELGAVVQGYSLAENTAPNHFELLGRKTPTIFGNILDLEQLNSAISEFKPEIIFHLAAQPLVRASYSDPIKTFKTNIIGTAQVLESVRQNPTVKAVIAVTTDKVYENKEWDKAYREEDPLGGYDPYSASKAGSEIVTASYRQSFFHSLEYGKKHSTLIASARSGNVIGGGDWADDRLIPDIMRGVKNNKLVEIRSPDATRPWQHVLEPLSGYLSLGAELLRGNTLAASAWNFGPSMQQDVAVKDVLKLCQNEWEKIQYVFKKDLVHHEAGKLQLDSTKALRYLHWQNIWDCQTSTKKTIEWYRSFYENNEVITEKQLAEYIADAYTKGQSWAQ